MTRSRNAERAAQVALFMIAITAGGWAIAQDGTPPDSTARDSTAQDNTAARALAAGIHGRQVAGRVRFLASDFMEGREAGTRGERLAAAYVEDFYWGLGLSPAGDDGAFAQAFDLHQKSLGEGNRFAVIHAATGTELATSYPIGHGFVPFHFSPSATVEAPVVFAGYGITAPEHQYDDYAGLDVQGAIVLVLRQEPGHEDPDSPWNGLRATRHAAFLSKVRLAQSRGAVGLLLVEGPTADAPATEQRLGNALARWSSLEEREEFDTRPPADPIQVYPKIAADVRIPALHISRAAAADLLAGAGRTLEELQGQIDTDLRPASRKLAGVRAAITTDIVVERVAVKNLVARLEGSDPAVRDEVVVVGGHFDHVGYGHFGSRGGYWGKIHPGADDNASGTAVVLSVAEAFAKATTRPRRSLLFVHFTAEEKGLMGSRWFVDHPPVPVEKMVAMLNLDMVGRNAPRVLSLVGDASAAGLDALLKRLGTQELGLELDNNAGSGVDRSDQWAFARVGVPAVAFFSGTHDDYHAPGDVAGKIVEEKLENVARLVTLAVWELAEHGSTALAPQDTAPPAAAAEEGR